MVVVDWRSLRCKPSISEDYRLRKPAFRESKLHRSQGQDYRRRGINNDLAMIDK